MALAACAAFVVTSATDARPAAAATRIEVEVGYAGGLFAAGRSVPVRVTVASDRLLRGELRIEAVDADAAPLVVVPIEVAGGSAKEVVVALPTAGHRDDVDVVASVDGARGEGTAQSVDDTELVGLLPGVAGDTPGPVPVPMDLGTARFSQLDQPTLAAPGTLAALGTIVAGADGLAGLDRTARGNVLAWLDEGGRLVADTGVGEPIEGLPAAWQPVDGDRMAAGRGEVVAAGGAVGSGRWADVVEPTSAAVGTDMSSGATFAGEDVSTSLARGSGLQQPSIGWLLAFLGAYVLVAGPLTFVLVRRHRRPAAAWIALGAAAAVFSGAAFVGGRDIRSNTRAAHASVVETGPAGTHAFTYLGLASPSGRDPRVELPADWSATGAVSTWFEDGMGFGDGMDLEVATPSVERRGDRTLARLGLEAGGYGLLSASGPLDDPAGLEVTANAAADGSVEGTVRNATGHELREVLVLLGNRAWDGGTLAPGDEVTWRLADGEGGPIDPWTPPEMPWERFVGWDGPPQHGIVDYALWADRRAAEVEPYPQGWVRAAGWTRDWHPPAGGLGDGLTGRTVFTSRAPVAAPGGALPPDAVRRQVVRIASPAEADERFEPVIDVVVRFSLPAGADPSVGLEALVGPSVRRVEVWRAGAWVALDCGRAEGDVVDPVGDPVPCRLPTQTVEDGALHLRAQVVDEGRTTWPELSVRAAR